MRGFFCFNSTWRTVQSSCVKAYSRIHTQSYMEFRWRRWCETMCPDCCRDNLPGLVLCEWNKQHSDVRLVEWRKQVFVLCHLLVDPTGVPPDLDMPMCHLACAEQLTFGAFRGWMTQICFFFSFNSLYQPHLSVNSSKRKTSAIFLKCDYRIWGRCSGLVSPPCSKFDWISNMFLFNVTVHTPMNQGASRVTKICYCPNLLLKGLCKVLCAFDENCYQRLRLRNVWRC